LGRGQSDLALWLERAARICTQQRNIKNKLYALHAPRFDKYLFPTLQQLRGQTRTAMVDAVMICHVRPITSGETVYRNGLTAGAERDRMKALCLGLIEREQPALTGTAWFQRIFHQRHVRTRWQQVAYRLGRPIRQWLDRST
jgi:hypothetical protein